FLQFYTPMRPMKFAAGLAAGLHSRGDHDAYRLIDEFRNGSPVIDDRAFDQIFPEWARNLSRVHWTPVTVALKVTRWLSIGHDHPRILDVGSGVGKLCLIGELTTPAKYVGVEQRPHFVELARELAEKFGISGVEFICGNAFGMDWALYHGIYLYNPFQENLAESSALDSTVLVHPEIYRRYVQSTEKKLAEMPPGTRVATYWGF